MQRQHAPECSKLGGFPSCFAGPWGVCMLGPWGINVLMQDNDAALVVALERPTFDMRQLGSSHPPDAP